jgi:uncharacterized OB-fold protein
MTNLNTLIDQYAVLKTELGKLEAQKKALEAALADLPKGAYESEQYRLTISVVEGTKHDAKLGAEVKAVLKQAEEDYLATLSHQYISAHTEPTSVRRHLVGLPTGKGLAAA